jgi:hypothetical protein
MSNSGNSFLNWQCGPRDPQDITRAISGSFQRFWAAFEFLFEFWAEYGLAAALTEFSYHIGLHRMSVPQ